MFGSERDSLFILAMGAGTLLIAILVLGIGLTVSVNTSPEIIVQVTRSLVQETPLPVRPDQASATPRAPVPLQGGTLSTPTADLGVVFTPSAPPVGALPTEANVTVVVVPVASPTIGSAPFTPSSAPSPTLGAGVMPSATPRAPAPIPVMSATSPVLVPSVPAVANTPIQALPTAPLVVPTPTVPVPTQPIVVPPTATTSPPPPTATVAEGYPVPPTPTSENPYP